MKIEQSNAFVVFGTGEKYKPNLFEISIFDPEEEANKFADDMNAWSLRKSGLDSDEYYSKADTFSASVIEFINWGIK